MVLSLETQSDAAQVYDAADLSFSDVVVISGIDGRQLRNGLDRGSLSVGTKLRVGRWAFSLRDAFQLLITARLTAHTWMPISVAADAANRIAPHLETFTDGLKSLAAELKADKGRPGITEFIFQNSEDGLEVMIHKRGSGDWGFFSLDGKRLDIKYCATAHVRLSVVQTLFDYVKSIALVYPEVAPGGGD